MEEVVIFKNALLIDGNGGDPLPDATVNVVGETIQEVISCKNAHGTVKGRIIDLKGKTLMPGLIDAHVHPGNVEVILDRIPEIPPAVYVHRVSKILEKDIDLGFTTLRDAGGLDWGFRAAIEQEFIRGPRLKLSVAPLTQTGGHADKRRKDRDEHVPRNSLGVYPGVCDGPDEVRKTAREMLRRGADQIKVMAEGGVLSPTGGPGNWQFTVPELRAAVEVAEAAGTYVMAHVYTPRAAQNCIEAGVLSIEHATLIDAETVHMMREERLYLVPTLSVFDVLAQKGRSQGMDKAYIEKLEKVSVGAYRSLESAYRADVKIGSGSDLVGPFQHLKGRELMLKAKIMGPMKAIVSATRTNSELLGLSDHLGTVEPGKWADLIVVDGNPLEDLSLFENGMERVLLVMKQGTIMKEIS